MNSNQEDNNWETDEETQERLRHEKIDYCLTLMLRETSLDVFRKNISFHDLISICCVYERAAEIIRDSVPQIDELYTLFDFYKVFESVQDSKSIRDCVNHFKPQTVILQSTPFKELPSDLLGSFSLFSPQKLIFRIKSFNQQFLIKRFRAHEIRLEFPKSWIDFDQSALALNSILQSTFNLESLELFDCPVDDFTVTAFGYLCLERLLLCNVDLRCRKIDTLNANLTKQMFMKSLILRYNDKFQPQTISFFVQLMQGIQSLPLESLEVSINNEFFRIDNIIQIPSLKFVRININQDTSIQTINHIEQIIASRLDIKYIIHGFSPIRHNNGNLTGISFNIYFNRLPNATGSWGPLCH